MKTSGTMLGKQRKLATDATTASKELQMSFKNTSNVANALTKDRVQIQNDLQKISAGKHLNTHSLRQGTTRGIEELEKDKRAHFNC